MFYKVLETKDLLDNKEDEKQVIDLMQNEYSHLKLMEIKKNEGFESHTSHTNTFVYIIDGEVEVSFPNSDSCGCGICGCDTAEKNDENIKAYKIKKNQMFMFEKEVIHNVKALKDCIVLVVKM